MNAGERVFARMLQHTVNERTRVVQVWTKDEGLVIPADSALVITAHGSSARIVGLAFEGPGADYPDMKREQLAEPREHIALVCEWVDKQPRDIVNKICERMAREGLTFSESASELMHMQTDDTRHHR